ncbi:iron-siderophore ABC transporter substrate-binding protein [Allorhizobium sp. BGMRC 0089]|uniref:iron-siderophore ABC transporter substrate-binding protein n=1 Tax=Allorhizobium sonneratiae TaxID=2934936 RepID=UPI002033C3B8|nr:iron-siderophore ABC transporter substrate-binding protein [Allorhizobium sonneratiae]MCM2294614.1 iron-siderophore ABC transporter substrate-binding protein [Allorhizobium sonneratiae]
MSADRFVRLRRRALLALSASALTAVALPARAQDRPQRIVCLDYGLASTLLALDTVPLAVASRQDWDVWVVEPKLPESVLDLGSSWEINFEALIALKPDLILTTAFNDALLPRLKSIAPVFRAAIYTPEGGAILPKAYATTQELGVAIGRQEAAAAFLHKADKELDGYRDRLSRHHQPPLALVNFLDPRHVRVYTNPGLYHEVLARIGLTNAWADKGNFWGFETIGIEELAHAAKAPDARLIAFEPVPDDVEPVLKESPLWQSLPFSRPGHFAVLPATLMFGMVNEALRFARIITDYLDQTA